MSIEPLHQGVDFGRDFWRAYVRRDLQEAFRAIEEPLMEMSSEEIYGGIG
jgi:hypothetical protein